MYLPWLNFRKATPCLYTLNYHFISRFPPSLSSFINKRNAQTQSLDSQAGPRTHYQWIKHERRRQIKTWKRCACGNTITDESRYPLRSKLPRTGDEKENIYGLLTRVLISSHIVSTHQILLQCNAIQLSSLPFPPGHWLQATSTSFHPSNNFTSFIFPSHLKSEFCFIQLARFIY